MKDEELYHHGVIGMKWGVRNAETLARYSRGGSGKPNKTVKVRKSGKAQARKEQKAKVKSAKQAAKAAKRERMQARKAMDQKIKEARQERRDRVRGRILLSDGEIANDIKRMNLEIAYAETAMKSSSAAYRIVDRCLDIAVNTFLPEAARTAGQRGVNVAFDVATKKNSSGNNNSGNKSNKGGK